MEDWKIQKVDKLFTLGRGRVINDEEIKNNLGDYPVYSSQTFNNGEFGRVNFYEFEGDYITWTTDGANAGKVFFREGRFNCTNVCGTLKAINEDLINTKFFAYLLDREAFKHVAVVGNNKLMNNVMAKIKVHYPVKKNEQTAIATILSKVDEAIAATQNSIKAAEKLKKALMQNLLTGKLKPDGSWRSEDEFYEDEKFGKVPKGWEVKKLKDVAVCLDSKRKPIKAEDRKSIQGVYPYYGAAGIIDYINDYIFDGRYLLFGEDGENLISRKVPQAFIVDGKFWVNNHAHILKEIENVSDLDFLCFSLESKNYENIVYGSAQPKINKSDLYKIKVLNPLDLNEQEMIAKKLNDSEGLITQKQTKIQTLQRLKKSLMQNLLTGKVRLPKAFIAQFEAVEEINNTIKTI